MAVVQIRSQKARQRDTLLSKSPKSEIGNVAVFIRMTEILRRTIVNVRGLIDMLSVQCVRLWDEFHYVFRCTDICIQNARVVYLPKYCHKNPNILKFESLFNVTNKGQLMKICKFLGVIKERVSSLS
jgi:hypothetical protein